MSAPLTLHEVADQLGVHYMTVYRYVRTGRLDATQDGRNWLVSPDALRAFQAASSPSPGSASPRRPKRGADERLAQRLVSGDEAGAWQLVEDTLAAGASPADIHVELVGPAMRGIGMRWANGELTIADEHRANAVAMRLIARLGPQFRRRGRRRGAIVIGAAPNDFHLLPVAIAADLLRGRSYDVVDLGAAVPTESFMEAASGAHRLQAIVVAVGTAASADALPALAKDLRCFEVPVLAGGPGVAGVAAIEGIEFVTLADLAGDGPLAQLA